MNATILAVNHMSQEHGGMGGMVVNISSIAGLDPIFLMPVYAASKEAIVGFTRAFSVRFELPYIQIYCKLSLIFGYS